MSSQTQFFGVTKQKNLSDLVSCSNGYKWQIKTHSLEKESHKEQGFFQETNSDRKGFSSGQY